MPKVFKLAWTFYGIAFAWLVAMAVWQRGVGGYLLAFAPMLAVNVVLLIYRPITAALWARRNFLLAPAALAGWLWFAGSYSCTRDAAIIAVGTIVTLLAFAGGRRALANAWRRIGGRPGLSGPPFRWGAMATVWLLSCWVMMSAGDRIGEAMPVPKRGNVVAPQTMPANWRNLKVGLALSGGGYRAAVMHAGVLAELSDEGVPITNLSTVSGGSIVGAFIAAGGSPVDFKDAVKNGRFRYKRDLTWPWNLLRLPAPAHVPWLDIDIWPFGTFSRIDVQAQLLDRVLLAGARADKEQPGPDIIINATDLRYGLSIGLARAGTFLIGPIAADRAQQVHEGIPTTISDFPPFFYANDQLSILATWSTLSRRAAVSGAFPLAFPVTELDVAIPLPRRSSGSATNGILRLALADGGIRDNLGFNVLNVVATSQRLLSTGGGLQQVGHAPLTGWRLDAVLISDGGKALQAAEELSAFGAVFRAIDLNGLETGALRRFSNDGKPAIELLSNLSSISFSPDLIVYGLTTDELKDQPGTFLSRSLVDDETLLNLLALVPQRGEASNLVGLYRSTGGSRVVPLSERRTKCMSNAIESEFRRDCLRYQIERLVGADLWRLLETFRNKSTLDDVFNGSEADDIFRFGRYLVRLKQKSIHEKLDAAAAAQR